MKGNIKHKEQQLRALTEHHRWQEEDADWNEGR
jgi:hypothetical protein